MCAPREENDAVAVTEDVAELFVLPMDQRSRDERALKLAGYNDAQIAKLLARTAVCADASERRAA